MKNRIRQKLRRHLLHLLLLIPGLSGTAIAQEYGIIDDVAVNNTAAGRQIHITFNRSAQYIGHTPEKKGRDLFIDLRLVGATSTDIQIPQQQQLRFHSAASAPLSAVSYTEESNSRARLELSFTHPVKYRVEANNDFRGISVTLLGEDTAAPAVTPLPEHKASPKVEKQAKAMMDKARRAMLDERNFRRALSLYQAVLNLPQNSHSRTALELLGLAHERLGQRNEAKAIYQRYLKHYPEGEGNDRVSQRLMSLVTATLPEHKQLRKQRMDDKAPNWEAYGSLSQFYLRDTYTVDNTATRTTASAVTTDLDLIAQRRSRDTDSRFRVTAGYYHDLLADGRGDNSRVSSLYAEHHDRKIGWWTRAGRQSSSRDGVLGKFDGIKLGYALTKRLEATVVGGSPVNSSRDDYNDTRQFSGAALNLGPFADNWEFSLYGIGQQNDSLTDREAVGGELRYYRKNLMVLGMLDYDTFYDELNIGMLLANWTLANDLTINTTIDVRKTPTLTTQNALQGQTVTTLAELRKLYTDDTIYQLARDRTAEARTFTLGVSRPVSKTLRLAGDLSVMNTSATVTSGGVTATPATDDEYFLNLQAIGTGVLNGDDISSLGFRMSDTTTAQSAGIYASSRLPLGDRWRFYPRLRADYREWKSTSQTQWSIGPVLRIEYRWDKVRFELEYGGDWTSRDLPDTTENTTSTYGSIGYRYEF